MAGNGAPGRVTPAGRRSGSGGRWDLADGDAESVLAEARKAFAYQFSVLLPRAGTGWKAHIGGLAGGVAAGWIFRERRPKAPAEPAPATGSTAGLNFPGAQPGRPAP